MIYVGNKEITGVYIGDTEIQEGFNNLLSLFANSLLIVFSNGYWIDEYPWDDNSYWID